MALSITQKLRIRENMVLLTIHAPSGFRKDLGTLPVGVKVVDLAKDYQQIHWFITNRAQLEKELKATLQLLKKDVVCWIYYPKGTSGVKTDLTRDKGWDKLLAQTGLQWLSLVSFNDTWSAFAMRLQTEQDGKKKPVVPAERPILAYSDPVTKTVRLPDDLATALKKDKKATAFFEMLSFTNKKEYVEWVITAKREETRKERVKESILRLNKLWKNPRNL